MTDRYNIDDGLVSIRAANDEFKNKKRRAMEAAKKIGDKKLSQMHSHTYQKQDSAIKEFASIPGHRAPGTWLPVKKMGQNKVRIFCINCGHPEDYSPSAVSGSGVVRGRNRCRCGETSTIKLRGFNSSFKVKAMKLG